MAKKEKFQAIKKQTSDAEKVITKRVAQVKFAKIVSTTFSEYKKHFDLYIKIALVVSLTSAIYNLLQLNQNGSDGNVITGIISTYGVMAIIWTHLNLKSASRKKIPQIYNTVSAKFLRVAVGNLLIGAASLPLILFVGFGLMAITSLNSIRVFLIPPFIIISGLLLIFVLRYALTIPIVMKEDITAFKAFRKSAKLTKKIKLKVLLVFIVFSLVILAVYGFVLWLYSFSKVISGNSVINTLTNAVLLTIIIPPISIFITKVYERQAEQG
jgi:hypothetical protein